MKELVQQRLSDSPKFRWLALLIVSFTMMCGYFLTDVMSPLQNLLTTPKQTVFLETYKTGSNGDKVAREVIVGVEEFRQKAYQTSEDYVNLDENDITLNSNYTIKGIEKDKDGNPIKAEYTVTKLRQEKDSKVLGWTSTEYGFFSGSYGYINVFLLMLFLGGIILDKMGVRFTGIMASSLMITGAFLKWYAVTHNFSDLYHLHFSIFDWELVNLVLSEQVLLASLGFAIFGVGAEITGITVSKVVVKWFEGKELALAMGLQVALARLGTAGALAVSPIIAAKYAGVSSPIFLGGVMLCIGLLAYFFYCIMDKKEDASIAAMKSEADHKADSEEEGFKLSDIGLIVKNSGFWLIAFLCLMFYGGVFPFLKFATQLMISKYHVDPELAGFIPAVLPFGTIILTPIFGSIYDRVGRGATLMLIGSGMLAMVHIFFALPILNVWWFAFFLMIVLGIAFSLVPSAMWPSVPKIIPMKQLGSAFSMIFYIQNIGLSLIPLLIGWVIETMAKQVDAQGVITYDYTAPMTVFALFGGIAILLSLLLLWDNKRKGYGLEDANTKS